MEEPVVLPEDPGTDPAGGEVGGEVGGEEDAVVDVVLSDEGEVAGLSESRPAATPVADVLPATGAAVDPWLAGLGAACGVAGIGLVRGRRTRTH
ncbi:LPXTG cell wall anchor domain-containing protein [Nocardioides sp. W3-2-3]|nr:LPXTG cell wall anchor domain-containing protein [Nocardioides convexus]